jgi:site-specific DNA recombinase
MKTKSPTPELKKQVGIWIRVSTEDQAQGDSPKHHETRARAYALSRDWEVREVYDLAGISGKSVAENSETKRMKEDIRKGRIQGLIFSKLARLARNTRELLDFADFFQEHNAGLISLQESIDTSTPAGRLFYTMIAAMAQWEREEIGERTKASVAVRAKSGKPLNGRLAFGYHFVDNKIQPHPTEAPVRKLMYELFAEHKRKATVVNMLTERGFRNREGEPFSRRGLAFTIRDTTAKGEYRSNYTYLSEDGKQLLYKPEHEWVVTQTEPLVSNALWQQCNDILDNNKAARARRLGPRPVHPFAGLMVCQCGEKMYVKSNTPKYICWKCKTKIPIVDMDSVFRDHLAAYLVSPENAARYVASANQYLTEKTAMIDTLKSEIRTVKEGGDKLFQLYDAGGLTVDQFKTRFAPIETRREQLDAELATTEALITAAKVDGMSTELVMSDAKELYDSWPNMTPERKRKTVELLVRKIVVRDELIEIDFMYRPTLEDMATSVVNGGLQSTVGFIKFPRRVATLEPQPTSLTNPITRVDSRPLLP